MFADFASFFAFSIFSLSFFISSDLEYEQKSESADLLAFSACLITATFST